MYTFYYNQVARELVEKNNMINQQLLLTQITPQLDTQIKQLYGHITTRITIINDQGVVLADSHEPIENNIAAKRTWYRNDIQK